MKTIIFLIVIAFFISVQTFSQQNPEIQPQSSSNPEALVSLSPNISYSQAFHLISKVSEKLTGKRVVSAVSIDSAIGVQLNKMNYFQALVVLTRMANLVYEEKPDVILIRKPAGNMNKKTSDSYVPVDAREVKISAVFFESDVDKARQRGINWQTIFSKEGLNLGFQLLTTPTSNQSGSSGSNGTGGAGTGGNSSSGSSNSQQTSNFGIGAASTYSLGNFFGKATAIFQLLETENVGQIISSPSVTVLDGTEAQLQDGQDLAIKQRDFSGNILEKFYKIGSIVTVTPHVLKEDGINYILLNIHVERSSFVPNPDNTIINKTSADTRVVMLNGEETVIGGMFINQNTKIRTGIPILKDLPWWVFGLRYIFGSDKNEVIKKELVILIKADLVPTLKERLAGPQSKNPIKDEIKRNEDRIKYYQFNQSDSNGN